MPRDGSGTYTLPAGNPVVTAETIASAWANTTMSDLATAMTDSLSRSGQGGMLTAFRFADGTVNAPGATWTNETVSGWYRAASQDFRYSINQADVFRLTPGVAAVFSGGSFRTLFHNNNDGAASGMDADLLDGQHGSFYQDGANLTAASVANAALANMLQATIKGRAAGAGTGVPVDLTAAQVIAIIATADGTGTGLDADLLDGQEGSFYQNANNLNAGTVPDARFPATLPAVSGANLTNLDANDLATGSVPDARIASSSVTQHMDDGYARNVSSPAKAGTTKTLSTSAPSGGSDGDIWYRY